MAKLHELKKGIEKHKEAQTSQYAVDGEKPPRLPRPGETVLITWADPNVIGSPKLTLGMLVSLLAPGNEVEGRVNGWVIMDPTMAMPDAHGRPVQVPALIPVGNVAYSRERKALTWCFPADLVEVAPENGGAA